MKRGPEVYVSGSFIGREVGGVNKRPAAIGIASGAGRRIRPVPVCLCFTKLDVHANGKGRKDGMGYSVSG